MPDEIYHGLADSDSISRYGGEISYILLRDNKEILRRRRFYSRDKKRISVLLSNSKNMPGFYRGSIYISEKFAKAIAIN